MEKEHLQSILDGINESIYISDPMTHEMLYANEVLLSNFGSFSQKKCYKYLQNNDSPCSFCSNNNIFGENLGRTHTWEFQNRKNNRWYRGIDKAIKWPDGRMVRCEIAVDIDDVKEKDIELERYNSHLNELVIERTKKIHRLAQLSMQLIGEPDVIFGNIVKELGDILDVNTVTLAEICDGILKVICIFSGGELKPYTGELVLEGTPCESVYNSKDIKVYKDVQNKFPNAEFLKRHNARTYCGIPCMDSRTNMLAVLSILDDKSRHFSDEDRDIISIIGQRIGKEMERQKIEVELRESKKKYEGLYENAQVAMFRTRIADGKMLECNERLALMFGYKNKADCLNNFYSTAHYTDPHSRSTMLSKIREKGEVNNFEVPACSKDDTPIWVRYSAKLYPDNGYLEGVVTEITEQKLAETSLRESEEGFRSIFENASIGMATVDVDGLFTKINKAFSEMLAYTAGELIGKPFLDIVVPADIDKIKECYKEFIAGKVNSMEFEKRFVSKGGHILWGNVHVTALKDDEGKILRFIGQVYNITDKKIAEEKLLKSEERYALVIEGASDGIWDRDLVNDEVYFSRRWKQLLGYKSEDFSNDINKLYEIIHPDDLKRVKTSTDEHLKGSTSHYICEFRIRHKDGSYRWVMARGATKWDETGKPLRFAGSHTDITERKLMEEELLKGQRLESIGVLAGGIAHDFNNILTGVITNLEVAKDCLLEQEEVDEDVVKSLNHAESAAMRAADLTRQLLTFSKGGAPVMKTVSVGELLVESASFVLRGSNVRRRCFISEDLWNAKIDENQISQVVNNLVINAQQSMPDGGTVIIRVENFHVNDGSLIPLKPGKFIKISIQDRGCGIPEENLIKIFDPYFTTKSKGTGLGLATSYTIVKRHLGYMTVESELGSGTIFKVYLPASDEAPIHIDKKTERDCSGFGRVLLLEDEDIVAKSVNMIASSVGYELEHARDGKEAVKFYRRAMKNGRPFDVVMMDLTIAGGMGGVATIKRLKKIDPFIKAIVCSGYSEDAVMANYGEYGFCDVLPKPFTKDQVLEKWANVIKDNA